MNTSVVQNTQDFRIYAILNISEPPRLLISKSGSKQFHCYFSLPLPPQIIVFRLGKCNDNNIGYNSRISIDISIGSESPSYRIGYLEKDVKSTCCEPEWSDDFLKRSHILHEKDKMAQLLLNIENGKSNVTPETFQQLEKRQLVIKLSKELTPYPPAKACSTKSPERPTKKNNCTEYVLSKEQTPHLPAKACSTKSPERPTKKMKKNNCAEYVLSKELTPHLPAKACSTKSPERPTKKMKKNNCAEYVLSKELTPHLPVKACSTKSPERPTKKNNCAEYVLSKEQTPHLPAKACSTKSPERPTKKMKKNNCIDQNSPKENKVSLAVNINNNHLVQTTLTKCFSLASKKCNMTDLTPAPSPAPSPERIVETHSKQNNMWPSSRWGHSVCAVSDNKVVVIGGQGEDYQMVKDSLCVLDHESNAWKIEKAHSYGADRRMGHTSTFDPVRKVIYVYGGSKNKRWFKDVHILNIETWKWSEIKAVGNAPKRAYHSSVLFQGELLVFGGVYPNPHPQPDGCSNDIYMFNPETSSWYQPIITGKQPLPRSGHSFKLCDENKAVIFGGWDAPQCYNDIITLDLALMEYNTPSVTGIKPTARSWHSSTLLAGNKLLIHGGFDEPNNRVLGDSFIFDIGKLTWLKVNTDPEILPRVGHTMFCVASANDSDEELVMLFGGGDNNGIFFNDLIHIQSFKD